MTLSMNDPENMADAYAVHRQEVASADILARNRARLRMLEEGASKAGESAAPPQRKELVVGVGDKGKGPEYRDAPAGGGTTMFGRATRDVVGGIVEGPRQALGGVSDAVHNSMKAAAGLADWIDEKLGGPIPVPLTGIESLDALISRPLDVAAGQKGEVGPAETNTGKMVREVTRFLTGFLPLSRAGAAVGMGKVAAGAAAGGVGDALTRDPSEENLANLLKQFPALQNPVADFLSSDANDPEVLARVKKGLEGAGLGLLADGLILGVKAVVQARRAGTTVQEAGKMLQEQRAEFGELADRDFLALGTTTGPRVTLRAPKVEGAVDPKVKIAQSEAATATGVPDAVAASGLTKAGETGGKEVYVNFGRINEPDDVKKVIGQMADAFKGEIDEARRGVQTNAATKRLADDMGLSVDELLARRKGEPFNAEKALAARQLLNASAEKLLALAERAAAPNAGPVDQFMFRKMLATHHAIQAEVIAARTETARALQSWSIPVGGGVERSKAVQTVLDQMGGPAMAQDMAKRLAALGKENVPTAAINKFVEKTWRAATYDAIREAWVNALLSSPKTHIVNMAGNTMLQINSVVERAIGEQIASVYGGAVAPGEAAVMAYGLVTGIKDAFRLAAKSFRTGEAAALPGKADLRHEAAITGDWLKESGHNGIAAGVDLVGTVARVPTRLLGAVDAFFKTVAYRAELYAQALRAATAEGKVGLARATRMMQIVENPPESIRLAAADAALYNTFTNATGDWGKALLRLRDRIPPLAFVMPFISTPVNIARYAFERSPVAPLVGQWRADIAAGGARAELALARMGAGTMVMAVGMDLAQNGIITGGGPDDPGEKEALLRTGWQPYSVKIGGKYYSYNRADPLGMTLGFAADVAELVHRYDIEPEEVDEIQEQVAAGIAVIANVAVNKTYMQGLSNAFEALGEADDRPDKVAAFINQLAASFVPAGVNAAAGALDPTRPEIMGLADAVNARIPGLREKLTRKRDLWGRVVTSDPGFGEAGNAVVNAFSPVAISQSKPNPIDDEMVRLNMNIGRIGKKVEFDGVTINLRDYPKVYERYVALAGNELKHPAWNLGAMDLLNAIVEGKHDLSEAYRMQADTRKPAEGGKAQFIMNIISQYREMARREILADPEFAEFAELVEGQKQKAREKRTPDLGDRRGAIRG